LPDAFLETLFLDVFVVAALVGTEPLDADPAVCANEMPVVAKSANDSIAASSFVLLVIFILPVVIFRPPAGWPPQYYVFGAKKFAVWARMGTSSAGY
jgi:hypothetical protein